MTTEIHRLYLLDLDCFLPPNIRSLIDKGFRGGLGGLEGEIRTGVMLGDFLGASFGFAFGFSFGFDFSGFLLGRSGSLDLTLVLLLKTGRHHKLPSFGPEEPEDILIRAVNVDKISRANNLVF